MNMKTEDRKIAIEKMLSLISNISISPVYKQTNHPGEDIRAAKAIYECAHDEQLETNVKLWMDFAREAAEHFGIKGIQQTAKYLNIKTNRL